MSSQFVEIPTTVQLSDLSMEKWIKSSSPADIGLAIEFGMPAVMKLKSIERSKNTQVTGQSICSTDQLLIASADTPTLKGQIGEEFVESILRQRFGEITNVAKVSKSGDLTLYVQHRKIIIEVKNYTNAVPTSGVEKFQRDLTTTNACGGLFISLRTPITSVTRDFTIRYENAETKTVPCAYIVSSDASAILIAVNMISSLIQSFDYLNTELYNKDKIISGVYDIADSLNEISRVRNDLQVGVGNLTNQMIKTTLGLAGAESSIRRVVDNLRAELFYVHSSDVEPAIMELSKNPMFSRQSVETRACVAGVMKCVQSTLHCSDLSGSVWKLSAKKCVNALSGIGFTFYANKVEISIPRVKIPPELIINALDLFGKKVNVNENLCVDLDKQTYDWVCNSIRNDKHNDKHND